jgi:tRNA modification GTPase
MAETIFAPITGRGGAVTVVRLSGADALPHAGALCGGLPAARRVSLRPLRDAAGVVLDHALVTVFAAPDSFTGEDCVELSLHGGRAVLAAVSEALVAQGCRPAEPGEFSRRAFGNGKLDLLQAEAIADLIAAETEAQRRLAINGADALQTACEAWREALRLIIAQQEALIDFPDEDLPAQVEQNLIAEIKKLHAEMQAALTIAPAAQRLRDGLEFVIIGAPNAGKSTLLNTLAGADIAIVSELPGTTRDAIGIKLDLAGIPVHITDTAGLRDTSDPIETAGINRARAHAANADLIIALAAAPGAVFPQAPEGVEVLQVVTKLDLLPAHPPNTTAISAQTGAGMPAFLQQLTATATRLTDTRGGAVLARPRQTACVQEAATALQTALVATESELRGEDLRTAATALGRLTGVIGVEEILDAVFGSFCIGK